MTASVASNTKLTTNAAAIQRQAQDYAADNGLKAKPRHIEAAFDRFVANQNPQASWRELAGSGAVTESIGSHHSSQARAERSGGLALALINRLANHLPSPVGGAVLGPIFGRQARADADAAVGAAVAQFAERQAATES